MGDWNQFIIQLGNADCDVIGINDYFSVAGYREVQRRLDNPDADDGNKAYREALVKLADKTLLPVVECRMTNVVIDRSVKSGPRTNFHIIFSPELCTDDVETFIKGLKVKGKIIGSRYGDSAFLLDQASVNFEEACQTLRNDGTFRDRYLIWMPYDEYGGIDNINPETDTLFKEGLVFSSDILGSSNLAQAEFFLWKNKKFTEDQYRQWFGRRKPCIKGSDSHNVNDELGKLRDPQSKPTDKYCWIKSDPTFTGLRQIINEPEDRVYIGRIPPKMAHVQINSTRYLSSLYIGKTTDACTSDTWFDCDIPLNFDMVAIIGRKGSGKSALADVLALGGNSHCDPKYFSFLRRDRFRERNGRLAKQFRVTVVWEDGTETITSLNAEPNLSDVELVKYIPQTYLEKVCTETEPGEASEFQRELRKVIFSHINNAERLGMESLDALIEYKTEELTVQLNAHRQQLSQLNAKLIDLETKSSTDNIQQLKAKLKLKRQELNAHIAAKPPTVEKPNNLTVEESQVYKGIAKELKKEQEKLNGLNVNITENKEQQKTLIKKISIASKLNGKLDNFEMDFERLRQESTAEFAKIGLKFDEIITLEINKDPLTQVQKSQTSEKAKVDATLALDTDTSLLMQKKECEARIEAIQEKLDAPNKRYHAYRNALNIWQDQKKNIKGDTDATDTLKFYEAQLRIIQEELPQEIADVEEQRHSCCRKLHDAISAIQEIYQELFTPVQDLIQNSVIVKEGFKLTFDSSIVERKIQRDFFEKFINQGVAGSFCGKDKGITIFEELRAEYDFNSPDDAIDFVEKIISYLRHDMRATKQSKLDIASQLRRHVEPQQLYDYLWSLSYLEPEYSMKLDGKALSHLSPGERGTLLLVFYLLVDRSNMPIIVDQPEENLDNQTVYRLLIPVIKEIKKSRQIIMVTHSPNIAVVCDAEQIIHTSIYRENGNEVVYTMGSIESPQINKYLIDVLEGTRPAFDNRDSKYYST